MRDKIFTPEYKTSVLPLRWVADYIFHPVSMWFFNIGLRANDQIYESGEGYSVADEIKEFIGFRLYKVLGWPYDKWGTVYKMDLSKLNLDLDDGLGWDDYDENGVPYWDYWWHEDPITGDAWRIKEKNDNTN
jgi:hypothetical protein